MLDNISKQINTELQEEQARKDFYDLVHEDFEFDNFIDNKFLNLNENGVNNKMLKNEMPFLFIEDTVVDDELVTNLQNEVDYEDDFERKPIADSDETTDLQEPKDYDDDFATKYASDVEVDTDLDKEVDYKDTQTTPVNIDEFSNEAAELLFEMGDLLGALELLEGADCDMTVPNEVKCPDEGDTIPQAPEAKVADTEYPNKPEGVVMEADDEAAVADDAEGGDDETALDEDFFSLFESSDEDCDDEDDDKDSDSDEDEDDEDKKDEDEDSDSDEDEDEDKDDEDDGKKSESFSILDLFG
jgi:hypothetical protein